MMRFAFLSLVVSSVSSTGFAATLVEGSSQGDGKTLTHRSLYDSSRMQMTLLEGKKKTQSIYFDGQRLAYVDHQRREYTQITRQQARQMAETMKQAQAMLKNMPPETRKMIEKRMGKMPDMNAGIQFRKGGRTKKGKWQCQLYQGFQGSQKVSDVCTVPYSKFGISQADFKIFDRMKDFMGQLGQMAKMLPSPTQKEFNGIPVWSETVVGGDRYTSRMNRIEKTSKRPAAFRPRPATNGRNFRKWECSRGRAYGFTEGSSRFTVFELGNEKSLRDRGLETYRAKVLVSGDLPLGPF